MIYHLIEINIFTYLYIVEKLENIIFYRIDKAIRSYRQYAQYQLKSKGFEMTVDQWIVMKCIIQHPEITQGEIAAKVFKDGASVTRIINLLVRHRYLSRKIMKTNRRRVSLDVTPRGIDILNAMEEVVVQNRAHALKGIDPSEIKLVEKVMQRISENCTD